MPEIGEVARAVHYIRKHLVGRTLNKVTAFEDANVFGKVGTSHTEIMKHLTGKKVVSSAQQGKYFWMIMSSPPHLVMHFGMAGWLRFKSEHTFYYRKKENEDDESWPPRWTKFLLETDGSGENKIEAAFVDMRRFARVRLVDCPAEEIRQHSPLVENGPDPVQDKDVVSVDWLKDLCRKKKVPIKAMLLDQANISGVGNWVGDEIMYDARMHPEQYANTLSDTQIEQLHKSLHYICGTAVDLLSDSDKFPKEWLFKHRWSKGKKADHRMPNGEKIVFLTVGGRTSAVIPSMQKKTGPVAASMSEAESDSEKKPKTKKGNKRVKEEVEMVEEEPTPKKVKRGKKTKEEKEDDVKDEAVNGISSKSQRPARKGRETTAKKEETESGTAAPRNKTKTKTKSNKPAAKTEKKTKTIKKEDTTDDDDSADAVADQEEEDEAGKEHSKSTSRRKAASTRKTTTKSDGKGTKQKNKNSEQSNGTHELVGDGDGEGDNSGQRRSGRLRKS